MLAATPCFFIVRFKWFIAFALLVFCLPSFSEPTLESIEFNADSKLKKNHGYVLLSVNTGVDIKKIYIKGKKSFYLAGNDTKKGKKHILLELPSGDYKFKKIYLFEQKTISRLYRIRRPYIPISDKKNWGFQVKPGIINYIGEVYLEKDWEMGTRRAALGGAGFRLALINSSATALDFLEKKLPVLLEAKEIDYSGPGKDDFFLQVGINKNKQGAK